MINRGIMRRWGLGLSMVALINGVFLSRLPLGADVISSRPSPSQSAASHLTSCEANYFFEDSRVQVVSGLWWEEWLIGVGFGGFLLLITFLIISHDPHHGGRAGA